MANFNLKFTIFSESRAKSGIEQRIGNRSASNLYISFIDCAEVTVST